MAAHFSSEIDKWIRLGSKKKSQLQNSKNAGNPLSIYNLRPGENVDVCCSCKVVTQEFLARLQTPPRFSE